MVAPLSPANLLVVRGPQRKPPNVGSFELRIYLSNIEKSGGPQMIPASEISNQARNRVCKLWRNNVQP